MNILNKLQIKGHLDLVKELRQILAVTLDEKYTIYLKKYPDFETKIPHSTFIKLMKADPTSVERENVITKTGKYVDWVVNLYLQDKIREEDLKVVQDNLKVFDKIKDGKDFNANKDITSYNTVGDLNEAIKDFINDTNLDARVRRGKQEAKTIYEDENWKIVIPLTKYAAEYYGLNTTWCTTKGAFDDYNDKGSLFIIQNKKNKFDKYQLHPASKEYKDVKNHTERLETLFNKIPFLKQTLQEQEGFGFLLDEENIKAGGKDFTKEFEDAEWLGIIPTTEKGKFYYFYNYEFDTFAQKDIKNEFSGEKVCYVVKKDLTQRYAIGLKTGFVYIIYVSDDLDKKYSHMRFTDVYYYIEKTEFRFTQAASVFKEIEPVVNTITELKIQDIVNYAQNYMNEKNIRFVLENAERIGKKKYIKEIAAHYSSDPELYDKLLKEYGYDRLALQENYRYNLINLLSSEENPAIFNKEFENIIDSSIKNNFEKVLKIVCKYAFPHKIHPTDALKKLFEYIKKTKNEDMFVDLIINTSISPLLREEFCNNAYSIVKDIDSFAEVNFGYGGSNSILEKFIIKAAIKEGKIGLVRLLFEDKDYYFLEGNDDLQEIFRNIYPKLESEKLEFGFKKLTLTHDVFGGYGETEGYSYYNDVLLHHNIYLDSNDIELPDNIYDYISENNYKRIKFIIDKDYTGWDLKYTDIKDAVKHKIDKEIEKAIFDAYKKEQEVNVYNNIKKAVIEAATKKGFIIDWEDEKLIYNLNLDSFKELEIAFNIMKTGSEYEIFDKKFGKYLEVEFPKDSKEGTWIEKWFGNINVKTFNENLYYDTIT